MHDSGDYNVAEIAALFSVSRPTVYRSLERTTALPALPADTRPEPDIAKYDQLLTRTQGTRDQGALTMHEDTIATDGDGGRTCEIDLTWAKGFTLNWVVSR